jgi:hypothetical protein
MVNVDTAVARIGKTIFQSGAWIAPNERPLPRELEVFLDSGEPPVYCGFGSMRAPHDLARVKIETARALGRRAVVSRGWAGLRVRPGLFRRLGASRRLAIAAAPVECRTAYRLELKSFGLPGVRTPLC